MSTPSTTKPEYYALLIGIDCYLKNPWYRNLKGCVRDISHVATFLQNQLKLAPENIFKLTASSSDAQKPTEPVEQWPTYENMVASFKRLQDKARPGDHVYIHYSGHGGRASTIFPKLKGEKGLDEALVPTDIGNKEARYLRDVELTKLLNGMVAKGLLVTVVLDSCHSGE